MNAKKRAAIAAIKDAAIVRGNTEAAELCDEALAGDAYAAACVASYASEIGAGVYCADIRSKEVAK